MMHYGLPSQYEQWIENILTPLGFSLKKPEQLAKAIKATSDHFIDEQPRQTPWEDKAATAAYLAYFFTLNYVRSQKVISEGQRLKFFNNITSVIDFGCGPGTVSKALRDNLPQIREFIGIDQHSSVKTFYANKEPFRFNNRFSKPNSPFLLLLSYVLNEIEDIPDWFWQAQGFLIMEPSTYKHSQALHQFRQNLLAKGYSIWAPCLHQQTCPLLGHKKDWCHDRLNWAPPPWFLQIEEHLPIKNKSLTFSYLLASKEPPPTSEGLRIIGDARMEKGKTKWLVCQPPERIFMSCLHRKKQVPKIYRGDIVQLNDCEKKSQEIRVTGESVQTLASFANAPFKPE